MDDNLTNFRNFIIRSIVKQVDYDAVNDTYTFNQYTISDDLIRSIEIEGKRYGLKETEAREYISATALDIKPTPNKQVFTNRFYLTSADIGQHLRIEIKHPDKGFQWLEAVKLIDGLFVLHSSIVGLSYGTVLLPKTNLWNADCYIDFNYKKSLKSNIVTNLTIRLGKLVSVVIFSPSVVHDILDSNRTYKKGEKHKATERRVLTPLEIEKEFISLLDLVDYIVKTSKVSEEYLSLKALINDLGISSYTLNTILSANIEYERHTKHKSDRNNQDEHFFIFPGDDAFDQYKYQLEQAEKKHKKELNAKTKKWNKKEGWFITGMVFVILLCAPFTIALSVYCMTADKIADERVRQLEGTIDTLCYEYQSLQRENELLYGHIQKQSNTIQTIPAYTFSLGASLNETGTFSRSDVMWIKAMRKVALESVMVRCINSSVGSTLDVGIFNENDTLVAMKSVSLNSEKFCTIKFNTVLETGLYYIKILNGIYLQFHYSNDLEYSQYLGGALIIYGSTDYSSRHSSKREHRYYSYFYNIRYHLTLKEETYDIQSIYR